jgi:hypothetical protein
MGISYSVDFIYNFPIVKGKPMLFWRFLAGSANAHAVTISRPLLDLFQNFNTLLTSLNVRISRGLEQFQSLNLAKSDRVAKIRKDDWSRAQKTRNLDGNNFSTIIVLL